MVLMITMMIAMMTTIRVNCKRIEKERPIEFSKMVKSALISRRRSTKVGPEFGPLCIPCSQNLALIYSLQPPWWTRCQISFCKSWSIAMHLNASHPVSMQSALFQYNQQNASVFFLNWRCSYMLSLWKNHQHSFFLKWKERIITKSQFSRTYQLCQSQETLVQRHSSRCQGETWW